MKNKSTLSGKEAWAEAWKIKSFRIQLVITFAVVISFGFVFNHFFDFVESRSGEMLNDPLLAYLPSYDVSWVVFFFLYSGIFIGLATHLHHPRVILTIFQTYILVTLLRLLTITLMPLEPPVGYFPLREPFVQLFTNGGRIISKDLFFSGHVSTILSLYFATHRPIVKTYLLIASMMIGSMVLLQHVHYTIDVIVAVPATFLMYWVSKNRIVSKTF